MPIKVKTVRIQNPDKKNDFMVIAEADFNPSEHLLFAGVEEVPVEQPQSPAGDSLSGLDLTVARLGPWLNDQHDIEMLTQLEEHETRRSALALIKSRIEALV